MELITGSYKALEREFKNYFAKLKTSPLDKVLIITQSARLSQRLKAELLSSQECLSCIFWQDILGLVNNINQTSPNYIPLKQKTALDYFKLKDFLQKHGLNTSNGYIQALQASFMDMQNALIMPQDLLKIEEFDPNLFPQDLKELIFIYQNYLAFTKQSQRSSYKDFFISALDNIEQNQYLAQFKQIIFYGIYDLTALQYDILKAVSQNYPTALFFPYENIPAYKYIQDFYLSSIIGLGTVHKKLTFDKTELEAFASRLFEVSPTAEQKKYEAPIKIINTSGVLGQVQSAAKEVLLLHKQGLAFKDIAVCARSLEPYKRDIVKVFRQHGIPININFEETFLMQPLINVCSNLLNIARNNFHKDSVLSFITSPYLKNNQAGWGQLIKDIGVQSGFNQWLDLLDLAIQKGQPSAVSLKNFLIRLEQQISLLEKAAPFNILVLRVKEIFKTFLALENLNEAEQNLFEKLENILEELACFDKVRPAQEGEFLEEFNFLLEQEKTNFVVNFNKALSVSDIMNLRGQAFKAIIILGLNEGLFPSKISEDPVFKDSWRTVLQKLGYNIKVSAQRYQEEKLFFYFALSAASQKAVLIYQRCDENGTLKIPSVYLNWVLKIIKKAENFSLSRRPLQQLLAWYEIAPDLLTPQEAALLSSLEGNYALAAALVQSKEEELFRQAFSLSLEGALGARDLVCKAQGPLWRHILEEGLSPTSLKNLYLCPAKYLFENILKRKDTSVLQRDKLDFRDQGTLAHQILEDFYKYLAQKDLTDKLFPSGALEILKTFITQKLQEQDYKKYGLYPLLWFVLCKEIEQNLNAFVKKDLTKIQSEKRKPSYFEQNITCELGSLKIDGRIDRIDISCDKNAFSIIDYKSSKVSGKTNKVIFEDANFQGPLYFELAGTLPDLKNLQPDKMIYASVKEAVFKEISYEDYLAFKETFWTLVDFLKSLIKEGLFFITPNNQACQYCVYADICRKNHAPSQRRAAFSRQAGRLREYRTK